MIVKYNHHRYNGTIELDTAEEETSKMDDKSQYIQ